MPSIPTLFLRALARRCPQCGQRKLFRRWVTLPDRCPRCGLRFEREEGAFLGSLALNYGVTGVLFITMLVVWIALTLPDVPVVPVTAASIVLSVAFPLFFYPFAKLLWTATDLILHGPDR